MELIIAKQDASSTLKYADNGAHTANAALNYSQLTEGAIGIYGHVNGTPVLLTDEGASSAIAISSGKLNVTTTGADTNNILKNLTEISIGMGVGSAYANRISSPIPLDKIHRVTYKSAEYTAGSALVVCIGDSTTSGTEDILAPSSIATDDVFILTIKLHDKDMTTKMYSAAWSDFTTNTLMINEIVRQINADDSIDITAAGTATVSNNAMTLTADVVGDTFSAYITGYDEASDVSITSDGTKGSTALVSSVGTATKLLELEKLANFQAGYFQERDGFSKSPVSNVVTGGLYDIYMFEFENSKDNAITPYMNEVIVAFSDADTNHSATGQPQGDFSDILDALASARGFAFDKYSDAALPAS